MSGKLFKMEGSYEKALIAFEECFYLASLNDDNKVKIKTIVSISSCYLDLNDLHKAIFYYHKLIDIEAALLRNSSANVTPEKNPDIINLELRIAIRQNLFTAHFRLGKLRICVFYLNEIIQIIDDQLKLNEVEKYPILNSSIVESFEFIQIKMDATIELIKLYILFGEFLQMEKILSNMLHFVENVCERENVESTLNNRQSNSLRYFKIKCYSYFGICQAGLRDYRYSKLCTRKSLCLIDRELEMQKKQTTHDEDSILTIDSYSSANSSSESRLLSLLKVECLIDASESCAQYKKSFKELKNFNDSYFSDENLDNFDIDEIESNKISRL
jgi:tetratricopeptide (TPR) repeat protein